eukprot:5032679-Amphidinium_carterae.1
MPETCFVFVQCPVQFSQSSGRRGCALHAHGGECQLVATPGQMGISKKYGTLSTSGKRNAGYD